MFEMSRSALRQRDGGLRAAISEYGMLAALILLIGLGSVTVAAANVNAVFTRLVDWIAAVG
jgi:Flp pilus assembly pilin Flp